MVEITERNTKSVEELTFADDFMFGAVMNDADICAQVIGRLLGITVDCIEYPELQKQIRPLYMQRGIRLDVYTRDRSHVYDIEIQTYRESCIGKRARYYQSLIDMNALLQGEPYSALKESYVIFLCMDDPFGKGLPVYTFDRVCREDGRTEFCDMAHHKVYNASAASSEVDEGIRSFLEYLYSNSVGDELTRRIADMVETKKFEQTFLNEYMAWKLHDYDVIQRGRVEGFADGRLESLRSLMANLSLTEDQAMDALGVPAEERVAYHKLLAGEQKNVSEFH